MDALSETLRVVRLVGAIFINARFSAPWCYRSPTASSAAPTLEPGAERVMIFHLITSGECYVEMDGQPPTRLAAGDAVIFPQGDSHLMASHLEEFECYFLVNLIIFCKQNTRRMWRPFKCFLGGFFFARRSLSLTQNGSKVK